MKKRKHFLALSILAVALLLQIGSLASESMLQSAPVRGDILSDEPGA